MIFGSFPSTDLFDSLSLICSTCCHSHRFIRLLVNFANFPPDFFSISLAFQGLSLNFADFLMTSSQFCWLLSTRFSFCLIFFVEKNRFSYFFPFVCRISLFFFKLGIVRDDLWLWASKLRLRLCHWTMKSNLFVFLIEFHFGPIPSNKFPISQA